MQFFFAVPRRRQYQSILELRNYLYISINTCESVHSCTIHSSGCNPRIIQTPWIFSSEVLDKIISQQYSQQQKHLICAYAPLRGFQKLILDGGYLNNVSVRCNFSELLSQRYHVSVNTKMFCSFGCCPIIYPIFGDQRIMLTPVFDFMLDFILGALLVTITCDQNRYTAFQIKLKYPLVSLFYNVFVYLLLDQTTNCL